MKMLYRPNGDRLTMTFGTYGALSTARFKGEDVTRKLRHLRQDDFESLMSVVGFVPERTKEIESIYETALGWADDRELEIFRVNRGGPTGEVWYVSMCAKGSAGVLPILEVTALFAEGDPNPVRVIAANEKGRT